MLSELLATLSTKLTEAGIATARLDVLVLLEDLTGKDRAWLLAHPEFELDQETAKKLQDMVEKRGNHTPLSYIRGKTEFYGREFMVNARTLEPRPESETMIELFKELSLPKNSLIADVGSGSGALGVTAALENPDIKVNFIDIDPDTLAIANANARKYKVKGQYCQGDLLEAWQDSYDALLCNLPYVPDTHTINQAAMQEPKLAIFGGPDGLDLYRKLFNQINSGKYGKPVVLTESLPFQHEGLREIALVAGYKELKEVDFIQVFKVV